ncbi:MAG: PLP-dependent cysteine synthase family protein [Candidatus Helarchaeota archaeon]|nr:PLP-dependent cysteine synthase family protein [Candidatus Helarchaeota archaeon]
MKNVYNSVLELVGRTPMVRINKINSNEKVTVYAKLEKYNPGGSVKDRIALYMIGQAEREGLLSKGKTVIIEPSSGNTGIGLALICAQKGYPLEIVMPETMTMERRRMLLAYGAKIILTEGSKGMDGAEDHCNKIVEENPDKYFRPNQFANKYNVLAHYETTGKEILEDTDGKITHFVAGIGTSGTIMGVSKRLKEFNPAIKVIGVEPYPKSKIQGLKNLDVQYVPKIYDPSKFDEKVKVADEDAFEMARRLTLQEGIFSGISSGAAMHVAIEEVKTLDSGVMVVILPDGGEKYTTTQLYAPKACLECAKKCQIQTSLTDEYIASMEPFL